jgi:hypothetical protein
MRPMLLLSSPGEMDEAPTSYRCRLENPSTIIPNDTGQRWFFFKTRRRPRVCFRLLWSHYMPWITVNILMWMTKCSQDDVIEAFNFSVSKEVYSTNKKALREKATKVLSKCFNDNSVNIISVPADSGLVLLTAAAGLYLSLSFGLF